MDKKFIAILGVMLCGAGFLVASDAAGYDTIGGMAQLLNEVKKINTNTMQSSYGKEDYFGSDSAEQFFEALKKQDAQSLGILPGHEAAHAIDMFAEKKVYDNIYKNIKATRKGLSPTQAREYANHIYAEWKRMPDDPSYAKYTSEMALYKARKKNEIDPSFINNMVFLAQENILQPWAKFNAEHSPEINAVAKFLVMASAMAFIFNKIGGTEYVRGKIREAFAKPQVYTIRRYKTGWFRKKPQDLIAKDDLVLAPQTSKQIHELIFLIRRRHAMGKIVKHKFTFPHVLLFGPPGTGKTSIAQMIADETIGDNGKPMNLIRLMASDFMQIKKEGDRIAVLKEMFDKAKSMGNTIIFLDEIDGMTGDRGKEGEGSNRAFLDHLLDEMATPSTKFMVIAATNHENRIDKALMSRFRRRIHVDLPTLSLIKALLDKKIHQELIQKNYFSTLDTDALAALMVGSSGRDIETFVTRLRDRLDFEQVDTATTESALIILREMGKMFA